MRIGNKEHQSFGPDQLMELAKKYPNDAELGEYIRRIAWKELKKSEKNSVHSQNTVI